MQGTSTVQAIFVNARGGLIDHPLGWRTWNRRGQVKVGKGRITAAIGTLAPIGRRKIPNKVAQDAKTLARDHKTCHLLYSKGQFRSLVRGASLQFTVAGDRRRPRLTSAPAGAVRITVYYGSSACPLE